MVEHSAAEHMEAKEEQQFLPLVEEQMVRQRVKNVAEVEDRPSDWDVGGGQGVTLSWQ